MAGRERKLKAETDPARRKTPRLPSRHPVSIIGAKSKTPASASRGHNQHNIMAHELPALPYPFAALEPTIDAKTMEIHHDKHHAAYVANLNTALAKSPELLSRSIVDILKGIDK